MEKRGGNFFSVLGRFPVLLAKMLNLLRHLMKGVHLNVLNRYGRNAVKNMGKMLNAELLTVLAELQINTLSTRYIDAKQNHLP